MYYQMNEGYLPLNGSWQDQSINVLVPRETAVKGVNMVCSRDLLPMGTQFPEYLAVQRKNFGQHLPKFHALADAPDFLDSRPAHFFEFTWESQVGPLHQMMIVVCVENRILSLTATSPGDMDDGIRNARLATLKSFRFGAAPADARNGTV